MFLRIKIGIFFCLFVTVFAIKQYDQKKIDEYLKNHRLWHGRNLTQSENNYYAHREGSMWSKDKSTKLHKSHARLLLNNTYSHVVGKLPESFDARTNPKWSNCHGIISTIYDQGRCGNCWAVSAASVFTDRICIQTDGEFQDYISASDLTSCCLDCHIPEHEGDGCKGGYERIALDYFEKNGIVTGGRFNSHQGCIPYPFMPGQHGTDYPSEECKDKCTVPSISYFKDLHYGVEGGGGIHKGEQNIMREIYEFGPVYAFMELHEEFRTFYHYPNRVDDHGIYHVMRRSFVAGSNQEKRHSVRILGWGVEQIEEFKVPYWIAANSWGHGWGNHGTFKIRRGNNEARIEHEAISAKYDKKRSAKIREPLVVLDD